MRVVAVAGLNVPAYIFMFAVEMEVVFICTILTIVAAGALTWVIPIFISILSEDIPNGKRDPYVFASFAIVVVLLSLIILG